MSRQHMTWLSLSPSLSRESVMSNVTSTYLWYLWMRHVTHINDTPPSYVCHGSCKCVTWLLHVCDTTPPYAWHNFTICVARPRHMYDMTHYMRVVTQKKNVSLEKKSNAEVERAHPPPMCVIWLLHRRTMTRKQCTSTQEVERAGMTPPFQEYMWHDSFMWVTYTI